MTTAKEAIENLDSMQRQIIHGKRTFGDIADVIRDLQKRVLLAETAVTACHSAMLGKVNPKHPAWGCVFAVQDAKPLTTPESCGDCDPCLGGRPDQCAVMAKGTP